MSMRNYDNYGLLLPFTQETGDKLNVSEEMKEALKFMEENDDWYGMLWDYPKIEAVCNAISDKIGFLPEVIELADDKEGYESESGFYFCFDRCDKYIINPNWKKAWDLIGINPEEDSWTELG